MSSDLRLPVPSYITSNRILKTRKSQVIGYIYTYLFILSITRIEKEVRHIILLTHCKLADLFLANNSILSFVCYVMIGVKLHIYS